MHAIEENKPGLSQPFSINQTGTLLTRHLAHFVSAIDNFWLIFTLLGVTMSQKSSVTQIDNLVL